MEKSGGWNSSSLSALVLHGNVCNVMKRGRGPETRACSSRIGTWLETFRRRCQTSSNPLHTSSIALEKRKLNFHSNIFTFHSLVDISLCLFLLVEFTRTFPNILIGRSMNPPLPCLQATRGTVNCLSYLISDAIIYIHVTAWLADMLFYETVGL